MFLVREISNAIDFQKALRSASYAYFKEFDGQGYIALAAQQERIATRFAISKSTSERIQKFISTGPTSIALIDVLMLGAPIEESLFGEDELNESRHQWDERFNRYIELNSLQGGLRLEPACSFWRVVMRTIFDDSKTVIEIPIPESDEAIFMPNDRRKGAPAAN